MADFNALKSYCFKNNRICHQPIYWNEMYNLIIGTERSDLPLPLILAGWWMSEDEEKSSRVLMHLEYAEKNGTLGKVDEYLRGLSDDQWYVSK